MSAQSLTTFVYETFGQQFGELLMAGYGAEPGGSHIKLYLTEPGTEVKTHWVIELIAGRSPCCDEPLVLAALLKLLLSGPSISQHLEFELGKLLSELQWQDEVSARRKAEMVIGDYVQLLYDKQVDGQLGREAAETLGGGCYHLLTGYIRGNKSVTGKSLDRTPDIVYFDAGFIEGLRQGQVYFAGINFGPLQTTSN